MRGGSRPRSCWRSAPSWCARSGRTLRPIRSRFPTRSARASTTFAEAGGPRAYFGWPGRRHRRRGAHAGGRAGRHSRGGGAPPPLRRLRETPMRLAGKTAVVTGGGQGIGAAVVRLLAARRGPRRGGRAHAEQGGEGGGGAPRGGPRGVGGRLRRDRPGVDHPAGRGGQGQAGPGGHPGEQRGRRPLGDARPDDAGGVGRDHPDQRDRPLPLPAGLPARHARAEVGADHQRGQHGRARGREVHRGLHREQARAGGPHARGGGGDGGHGGDGQRRLPRLRRDADDRADDHEYRAEDGPDRRRRRARRSSPRCPRGG